MREPVYYGASIDAAVDWIERFQMTRVMLQSLDAVAAERERKRLREIVAQHHGHQGVWFGARAWIVSARCQ